MDRVAVIDTAEIQTAEKVTEEIKFHLGSAQQSLIQACMRLAEVRDRKLYKVLNCRNFEEYCVQKVGLSYNQAYRYTKVGEMLLCKNLWSTKSFSQIERIGIEKLYLVSRLNEGEISDIMAHSDLGEITLKELKAEIKSLRGDAEEIKKPSQSERVRELEQEIASLKRQIEELNGNKVLKKPCEPPKKPFDQYKELESTARSAILKVITFVKDNQNFETMYKNSLEDLMNRFF